MDIYVGRKKTMKFVKWKTFFVTSLVCLLPILLGICVWDKLPDSMAIHFDFNNNPDNFASKEFAVFALPVLMVILQFFCCFINDINSYKHGERKKFERVTKWIIPVMAIVLQSVIIGYALGIGLDTRIIAVLLVGVILIIIGNYLPKFDYVKDYNLNTEKARKINRFLGFESVIMGVLFILSAFLPPISSVICLILLIPYTVIGVIYGIKTARK